MASNPSTPHRLRAPQAGAAPADNPLPFSEKPGYHNFFMIGMETLFLSHMPMFTMERHMYQVILRATLDPETMEAYQESRAANPTLAYNLVNQDSEPFTLPQVKLGQVKTFHADLYLDYQGDQPINPWLEDVQVQVEQIVHFRHFDFDIPYPAHLTYILFGAGNEAHLSHYIARDPDFQHIVTLGKVPDWIDPLLIEIGPEINILDLPSQPTPCSSPLTGPSYAVTFQGWDVAQPTLDLAGAHTVWFSTGNLLNAKDPCQPG